MQQIQQDQSTVDSLLCPSFSTYSTNKLDHIADQVVTREHQNDNDFEFVAFPNTNADALFLDGAHAARVFPIFNRQIFTEEDTAAIRVSFGNLMVRDDENAPDRSPSSSSSEEEDAVAAGSFCLWTPKSSVQASPSRCKKSNSTGSSMPSKRWKLLSFLLRSNSEGKASLASLGSNSVKKGAKAEGSPARVAGKMVPAARNGGGKKVPAAAALEGLYVRKGEIIRRSSYLPYRQNLGFGVGLNAIGRGFPLQ